MSRAVARVSVVRYLIADVVVRPISDIAVPPVSSSRFPADVLLPGIRAARTHETGDRIASDTGDRMESDTGDRMESDTGDEKPAA